MAQNSIDTSALVTTTASVTTVPITVSEIMLMFGTLAATLTIRNNTSGTGNPILTIKSATTGKHTKVAFPNGMNLSTACHATIAGAGAQATITYHNN